MSRTLFEFLNRRCFRINALRSAIQKTLHKNSNIITHADVDPHMLRSNKKINIFNFPTIEKQLN